MTESIDKSLASFLDKYERAFTSDDDIDVPNRKTSALFEDLRRLHTTLVTEGGQDAVRYAERYLAGIPGLTLGLRRVSRARKVPA